MSQSPDDEKAHSSEGWLAARNDLAEMIKRGRSFSGHERNCCFLNTGGERFATISAVSGLDFDDDARAVALVDWDHDGDLDAWISNRNAPRLRFMRNDAPHRNRSLTLQLVGNGISTNRDAIGARVEVVLKDPGKRRNVQTLRAGEGFLAQSSKLVHFGLGEESEIERVVVDWPGGRREEFLGLEVDQRYRLTQASGTAERLLPREQKLLALIPSKNEAKPLRGGMRVPLCTQPPMPTIQFESSDGASQTLTYVPGRYTLVHLWASWCEPCLRELVQFTQAQVQLRSAGIDVLALAVDGLGDDASSAEKANSTLKRIGFPFPSGQATSELLDTLQAVHNELVVLWEPLPVPTSFLVDPQGNLIAIYKGPLVVDQLLQDAAPMPSDYAPLWQRAAILPGRSLDDPVVVATAAAGDSTARYRIAALLETQGRLDDAIAAFTALALRNQDSPSPLARLASIYLHQGRLELALESARRALQIDAAHSTTHNTLGLVLVELRKFDEAQMHYEKAIEFDPESAIARNNLGSLLASQGDLRRAELLFSEAIEINEDFAEALTNLGSVFASKNDLAAAAKLYQRALRADPEFADAHNSLGTMYARSGHFQQAIASYEKALQYQPDYQEARENLRRARIAAGAQLDDK